MRQLVERIGETWCISMHHEVMWPMRGKYQCRKCLREYPVVFETPEAQPRAARRDSMMGVTAIKAA